MHKLLSVGSICIATIGALTLLGCDPPKPKAQAPVVTSKGGPVITSPGVSAPSAPVGPPLTDAQKKLFVDRALETAQGGRVMTAIDTLEKSVGGDPYLDVLRGSISFQAGDLDQAIAAGKRAAERDPTLEGAHNVIARAA